MSEPTEDDKRLVARRAAEWAEFQVRWRWLADSFEGGDRYRNAIYGWDYRRLPIRNLVRHKREYPAPTPSGVGGSDVVTSNSAALSGMFSQANPIDAADQDNDYGTRRIRTPVPEFVREAVDGHLSQIYAREVHRRGPPALEAWWADCDGAGVGIDRWMRETVAPLFLTLGQIDLCFDLPTPPPGESVETMADMRRLKLDRPVASYILPENMLWWRLDARGDYVECLVLEHPDDDSPTRFRHWTADEVTVYEVDGASQGGTESIASVARLANPFGFVPIKRVFDRRRARCRNVGLSRYEGVAEHQREYYNRDSELILSDTTQAHPLLQGPEDFVQADGTVPIGPSWMLPKKKDVNNSSTHYEGFEVIAFPKDGAASIRQNKADIREQIDRLTHQIKPAGSSGSAKGTVEQSGISKAIDYQPAHNQLAQVSASLQRVEEVASTLAMRVASTPVEAGEVDVVYPSNFDLYTASDVAVAMSDFQNIAARTGMEGMADSEGRMLSRLWRLVMPGLSDDEYKAADAEIAKFVASGGGIAQQVDMQALTTGTPAGSVQSGVADPTSRLQPPGKGGGKPDQGKAG